jgi:hypothetical protein
MSHEHKYINLILTQSHSCLFYNLKIQLLTGYSCSVASAARELTSFIVPREYPLLVQRMAYPEEALDQLFYCLPKVEALRINVTLWPVERGTAVTSHANQVKENVAAGRTPMSFKLDFPNTLSEVVSTKPLLSKPLRRLLVPTMLAEGFFSYLLERLWQYRQGTETDGSDEEF